MFEQMVKRPRKPKKKKKSEWIRNRGNVAWQSLGDEDRSDVPVEPIKLRLKLDDIYKSNPWDTGE